jgi:hypothetical protein
MFRHNYLTVNGIVAFSSFTSLYKKEYKQGEMWHSAQRAEISEAKWMYVPAWPLPGSGYDSSAEANNEEFLIARQEFCNTDISTAKIDHVGYKRKATDSFKRVHDESP